MINQQFTTLDSNIRNTHHFRTMLKEKFNHRIPNQNIEIKQNKVNIKTHVNQIKSTANQLRQQLDSIKSLIPKSFSDFLPAEYHNYLPQPQKIMIKENIIEKPSEQKLKSSNKENMPVPSTLLIKEQIPLKQNKPQSQIRPASTDRRLNQIPVVSNLPINMNDTLRNKIYRQLQQLKGMQKRENTFRMINYSSKSSRNSVSTVKRKNDQLIVGAVNQNSESKNLTTKVCLLNFGNQAQSQLTNSNITVQSKSKVKTPIQIPVSSDSLQCPNKHQYYAGKIQNGVPEGNGRLTRCCDKIPIVLKQGVEYYNGGFQKGKFHGFGTLTIKGGIRFVGTFKDGMRQGEGSLYYGGKVEVGRWKNDQFISNI